MALLLASRMRYRFRRSDYVHIDGVRTILAARCDPN
jgi:hypothetical protein